MRPAWAALLLAAVLCSPVSSCKLQETPPAGVLAAKNVCTTSADCAGRRVSTTDVCLSTSGGSVCESAGICACFSGPPFTLPDHDLTFAITPAALSGFAGGRTFLIHGREQEQPAFNPGVMPDIVLPSLTPATITVTPPPIAAGSDGCSWLPHDLTLIPIRAATFTSVDVALGLPGEVVVLPHSTSGSVSTTLTPGRYDLYIEPDDDPACPIPPVFVSDLDPLLQVPAVDLGKVQLSKMQGTIKTPTNVDFTDYRVEIVEESSGSRISTIGGVMPSADGKADFGRIVDGTLFPLEYYAPIPGKDATARHFWVRLTPRTQALPSYAFRNDIFVTSQDQQSPQLDFSGISTSPVTIGVRMESASTSAGVAGSVYVESVPGALSGVPPEIVSSFSTSALTSASSPGDLRIVLPAGKYRANGVAVGSELGIEVADWDIPSTPAEQGGRLLELHPRSPFAVHISTPGGVPAANVVVELDAVKRRAGPFDSVFNAPRLVPRSTTGITDAAGRVVLSPDAGGHSLRVRFAPETLLPWTTVPLVDTSSGALELRADLPVELDGRVLATGIAENAGIQGGTLRVYTLAPAIAADASGNAYPARYVLVGEAELGADEAPGPTSKRGTYRVFLPPSLDGT